MADSKFLKNSDDVILHVKDLVVHYETDEEVVEAVKTVSGFDERFEKYRSVFTIR